MTPPRGHSSQHSNADFYERIAPIYELVYGEVSAASVVGQWVSLLEARGHIPTDREDKKVRLIDVGCGPGWYLAEWSRAGFQVSGMDSSPAMLARARRQLLTSGITADCPLYLSDIRNPAKEIPAGTFDLVVSHFNFLNLFPPDTVRQVFAGVKSLLRPKGVWVTDLCEATADLPEFEEAVDLGNPHGSLRRGRTQLPEQGAYSLRWSWKNVDIEERFWLNNGAVVISSAEEGGFGPIESFEWLPSSHSAVSETGDSIRQLLFIFPL